MGDWLSWALLAWEEWIPMLILRSVESEQTSREKQPLQGYLWMSQCSRNACKIALCPRGNFTSGNPTEILSHFRIPEQRPTRGYCRRLEPECLQRPEPISWSKPIPGTLPFFPRLPLVYPRSSDQLHHRTGRLLASISATPDLGVWTTINTALAIWVGEGSVLSLLELESSVSFNQKRFSSDS